MASYLSAFSPAQLVLGVNPFTKSLEDPPGSGKSLIIALSSAFDPGVKNTWRGSPTASHGLTLKGDSSGAFLEGKAAGDGLPGLRTQGRGGSAGVKSVWQPVVLVLLHLFH